MNPADLIKPEAERIARLVTETDFMAYAIAEAQKQANEHQTEMTVVHAPIEHGEEIANGGNPFGYCPTVALTRLYRFASVICTVKPNVKHPRNPAWNFNRNSD